MKKIRILVTGAGSGVGQGIIKSLKISNCPITIISSDISSMNAALYRTKESIILPKVEEKNSLNKIIKKIIKYKINIIMIGSEFDLKFYSVNKNIIEEKTNAMEVVYPLKTINIGEDKWKTVKFLKNNNLPYAKSYLPKNIKHALKISEEIKYPYILKTRFGTSNRHVHIITNKKDIIKIYETVPKPLIQELIILPSNNLSEEYTCSIFKCTDGSLLGPFTARRTLKNGTSWQLEVKKFGKLYKLLTEIGKKLDFMGSLNIQLSIGKNGPIPFEFNTRFSGTTAVRAHFGFNEPDMVIKNYYLKNKIKNPKIKEGIVLRYLEEIFINNISKSKLNEPLPKGLIRSWF